MTDTSGSTFLFTLIIPLLGFLLVMGIGFAIYHFRVRKPINIIREKADQIVSGELEIGQALPEPEDTDLAGIVRSINLLSSKLKLTQEEMEERVNERTRLLEEGSRLVQEVLDTTPNLLCLFNLELDTFNYVNREFSDFFGVSNEEMLRLGSGFIRGRVYPVDQEIYTKHINQLSVIPDNDVVQSEFRLINYDGIPKWISFRSLVFQRNGNAEPKLALFVGQDITDFKETEERLRFLSVHDQLTGLYNRLYFEEEIVRLEKGRLFPISTIMADVDGLKAVNDSHGHSAGDQLLIQTATIFRSCFRAEDVVARIGGDEFAALLPGSNACTAYKVIERINNRLKETSCYFFGNQISISIGMATTEKGGSLLESLKTADQSMYTAKQIKRNEMGVNDTRTANIKYVENS
jgi:diguanylate cyclase (GGDEF)-like protein/PAS domain S-box-containing protein